MDGYLVPCDVCLVDQLGHILTYDTSVVPPNQSGVIITPPPARFMLAEHLESKR